MVTLKKINTFSITLSIAVVLLLNACASPVSVQEELSIARSRTWHQTTSYEASSEQAAVVIDGQLSLDQAIGTTLAHNRSLQAVLQEHHIAQGRIFEAYEGVLPTVSAKGSYNLNDSGPTKTWEGFDYPIGQKETYTATLSVVQPLFSGAALAGLKASRYYDALAREQVNLAVQQAVFATIQSYLQVLLAREQVGVTRIYVNLAESHLKDVQTRRKFGTASDFNVLRSQVELSGAKSEMIRYTNQFHEASAGLLKTLGISQESHIDLTGSLTYEPLSVDEETAIKEALQNRPDLAAAFLGEKLQEQALNAAKSEYLPTVAAFYNYTYGNPDPHLSYYRKEWDDAWVAGIQVSVPILKGLGRKGRMMQSKAELKKQQIKVQDAWENAQYEVRNAILSLEDARQLVETQQLSLEQAREGLRIAEIGYREGSLDQVSVLEARAALTQAQLIYYQSLYQHSMARTRIELVKGTLEYSNTQQKAQ